MKKPNEGGPPLFFGKLIRGGFWVVFTDFYSPNLELKLFLSCQCCWLGKVQEVSGGKGEVYPAHDRQYDWYKGFERRVSGRAALLLLFLHFLRGTVIYQGSSINELLETFPVMPTVPLRYFIYSR